MSTIIETSTIQPAVIPYFVEKSNLPAGTISGIYRRLVAEDILADLVPEQSISEDDFIEFVNGPALLSLFLDLESKRFCGIAWLTDIQEGDLVSKGCAAVAFFREWWKPEVTKAFGEMVLGQWFNILGMDIVYVMTPKSNRLAARYCRRMGIQYRAELPNFVSRRGEVTNALLGMITRDEFNQRG